MKYLKIIAPLIVVSTLFAISYQNKNVWKSSCCSHTSECCNEMMPINRSEALIMNGKPTTELLEILNLFGVAHDGTLESIVQETQKIWLRKPGQERWDLIEAYQDKKEQALTLFKHIGSLDEIAPNKQKYTYALFFGAALARVRTRLAYLLELHEQGVQFDQIIFLGAQRPLQPFESHEHICDMSDSMFPFNKNWQPGSTRAETEYDMMQMVYSQADLPESFKAIPVVFIDTPMQQTDSGTMRRPNTGDTIFSWLATNPQPGSCLCISNQPYVCYQDAVARFYIPNTFRVETVGSTARGGDVIVTNLLDNSARTLYQTLQNKNKNRE